jgi:hypothetical protein|tara:strand:- start:1852 stop:2754 length:903 start_codon:yes stop_codon:yes gene_type:complete
MQLDIEFSHLSVEAAAAVRLPDDIRVNKVWESLFVATPQTKELHSILQEMKTRPDTLKPRGLVVHGDTDVGKSWTLDRFVRIHPPRPNAESEWSDYDAIRIDTPADYSWSRTCHNILDALNWPNQLRPTERHLHAHTVHLIARAQVKLLIFDEFTNVAEAGKSGVRLDEYRRMLRALINESKRPVVVSGMKEVTSVILLDQQLGSRITDQYELRPLKLNTGFPAAFTSFCFASPLRRATDIKDKLLIRDAFEKTGGCMGSLSNLMRIASLMAIMSGEERITRDILNDIQDRSIGNSVIDR